MGLIPAASRISDRVVLSEHTVSAGTSISGTLEVTNQSPTAVNLTRLCRPNFAVVIASGVIDQRPGFAQPCTNQPFIVEPGTNSFPISVLTTYFECLPPGSSSLTSEPSCTGSTMSPLPAGSYHTILYGSGDLALPEPAPVAVTVTP
jgi:hypothetical protein